MTPTSTPSQLADPLTQAARGGVRIERKQDQRVGPFRVRLVDARRRADEPVARLGDDERAASMRTIRRLSWRITSMRRASSAPASSRARSDGSTSSRCTTRPSTFETAFCATTTMSPLAARILAFADSTRSAARSSPSSSSGMPRSGMTRSSPVKEARSRECRRARGIACSGSRSPPSCPRARAHSRAGRHRAPCPRSAARRLRARGSSRRRRHRRRTRPRREARPNPESMRCKRMQSGENGAVELGLDPLRQRRDLVRVGRTPEGVKRARRPRESTGSSRSPRGALARSRGSASAFVASTTRSASRTASAFVAPFDPELACGLIGAGVRLSSRGRPRDPPDASAVASAVPNGPVPPTIAIRTRPPGPFWQAGGPHRGRHQRPGRPPARHCVPRPAASDSSTTSASINPE